MNYHNITKDDMLNGDGLRVVLWSAGCSHHCKDCQNPITWDPNGGIPFDESAKLEIFDQLEKDYIAGITFSGGDPLHENNVDGVLSLIKEIKEKYPNKNIWLYSGYRLDEIFIISKEREEILKKEELIRAEIHREMDGRAEILQLIDVFVDGKFEILNKDVNCHWRGSSNQKIWKMEK